MSFGQGVQCGKRPCRDSEAGHPSTARGEALVGRQYRKYSELLYAILLKSLLVAVALATLAAVYAGLSLVNPSGGVDFYLGDLNWDLYLSTLAVLAASGIGLQVAVRSPVVDEPLARGRREWLGQFSWYLTAATSTMTCYLFAHIVVVAVQTNNLMGEYIAALFLGFGVACISADAAVVAERNSRDPRHQVIRSMRERVKLRAAIRVLAAKPRMRKEYRYERVILWGAPPFITGVFSLAFSEDSMMIVALVTVSCAISFMAYYWASYLIECYVLRRRFGYYVSLAVGILYSVALLVVVGLPLTFSSEGDLWGVTSSVVITLWVVVSPGAAISLSLAVEDRKPLLHETVSRRLEGRLKKISDQGTKGKEAAQKSAATARWGLWLFWLIPVGWLLAEQASMNLRRPRIQADVGPTRYLVRLSRYLTAVMGVLLVAWSLEVRSLGD